MPGKGPTKFGRAMFEKKKNTFAKEKMTSDDAYRTGAKGGGLYANIHAKRKRGGKMRKKGAKGAPTAANFKRAKQTARKR